MTVTDLAGRDGCGSTFQLPLQDENASDPLPVILACCPVPKYSISSLDLATLMELSSGHSVWNRIWPFLREG